MDRQDKERAVGLNVRSMGESGQTTQSKAAGSGKRLEPGARTQEVVRLRAAMSGIRLQSGHSRL